jgi:DNA uptake protein ComE-like DNA-binding protein
MKPILFAPLALLLTLSATTPRPAASQVGKSLGVLDPNLAPEKDLLALPHLNATIVKGLLEQRPFLSMADLQAYLSQTLSKEQLTELYGRLFLALNLNTASREEILLIPGVGNRMVREFLEYRPYKALAQFRREIGKYVDAQEEARLEQYVFVPIDLNSASDEDILSIPGIGNRMLREFKEYRPYENIERFRREIGKYVSPKEVARLERYVMVR